MESKVENREKILQCAEELFYSRGYDAAGVQEIVERAGVTKPTLYYYFGSKKGLLKEILETKFTRLTAKLEQVLTQPGGIRSRLYEMAGAYYDFFAEEHKFYMLLMALFYSARENEAYQTAKPYYVQFYRIMIRLFDDCSFELGNMNGRQQQFAVSFIGVMNQYLTVNYNTAGGICAVTKEEMHGLVDQFMHGIFS